MARQTFFFPPCGSKYLQETEKKSSLNVLCVRSIPRDELTTNHFLKGVCTIECALCQVACTGYTELICNPLYKLYLQITVVIFPYNTNQVVHGLGEL